MVAPFGVGCNGGGAGRLWHRRLLRGEATIAHLLVLFSPHHAFDNAQQAVAFVGLAPSPNQSGNSEKLQRSKIGDPLLRTVLYVPALIAWQRDGHPGLL